MEQCYKQGLAKAVGVSNFNSKQIQRILDNSQVVPANNQVGGHYVKLYLRTHAGIMDTRVDIREISLHQLVREYCMPIDPSKYLVLLLKGYSVAQFYTIIYVL